MGKKSQFTKKMLRSYLYILLLPLAMCFILYAITSQKLSQLSEKRYMDEMEKACYSVNTEFDNIGKYSSYISANELFNAYKADPSAVNTWQMQSAFAMYLSADQVVDDIYLYNGPEETIISSKTKLALYNSYGNMIKRGHDTYDEFKDKFLKKRAYKTFYKMEDFGFVNKKGDYIACVTSIPFDAGKNVENQLILTINEEIIDDIFKNYVKVPYTVKITDKKGNMIYSNDAEDRQSNYVYEYPNSQFIFSVGVDIKNSADINVLRGGLLIVIILLIVISLIWGSYVTVKNTKSVERIIKLVNSEKGDMESTYNSINHIIESNTELFEEVKINREILKSNIYLDMTSGFIENEEDLKDRLRYSGVDLTGKVFLTVCMEINLNAISFERNGAVKILFSNFLAEKHNFFEIYINEKIVGYIFSFQESSENNLYELENSFADVVERISSECLIKIAVSEFSYSVVTAVNLVDNVRNTLLCGVQTYFKNIVWCSATNGIQKEAYYFPIRYKTKLIQNFFDGDYDSLKGVLDIIYIENISRNIIYNDEIENLLSELKFVIKDILKMCPLNSEDYKAAIDMLNGVFMDSLEKSNYDRFYTVIDFIASRRLSENLYNNESIKNSMLKYIDENFADVNMSRQKVADQFGISPQYVSKYFKDNFSINFLDYLEKVRIDFACKLLMNGESVESTAQKVGYDAVVTFRRVFKKRMGVTPTKFKE